MSALFSPIKLGSARIRQPHRRRRRCASTAPTTARATDWHLAHLGMLANSGAGLVIVEATHVERRGRITHGCIGLYSDDNEAALARVIAHCRRAGTAKLGIQIAHAGRKASVAAAVGGRRRAAARAGPVGDHRALADSVRAELARAARGDAWTTSRGCARPSSIRPSARCGSASTPSSCTTRTAIWRIRSCRRCPTIAPTSTAARWRTACASACEIAQAVRAAVPKSIALGARITGSDWRDDGLSIDDAVTYSKALKA